MFDIDFTILDYGVRGLLLLGVTYLIWKLNKVEDNLTGERETRIAAQMDQRDARIAELERKLSGDGDLGKP